MRARFRLAILFCVSTAGACGEDDLGDEADAARPVDARPAARIQLPATNGELLVDFRLSVTGDGSDRVGSLSILNGSGTIDILSQTVNAAVYAEQPWPEAGYTLYQALAVAEDQWFVAWFYCAGNELLYIYLEGTDGTPLGVEPATGTCSIDPAQSSITVAFPAVDMPPPQSVGHFSIAGPDIALEGLDPGVIRLDQTEWVLLPFEYVNCTGGCGVGTWYELHAVLSDPGTQRAAFCILYMTVGYSTTLALEYFLSLPDLGRRAGTTSFTADWSYE